MIIHVQNFPISLKSYHDFSWLNEFGEIFVVFDQLISGNICFGVEGPGGRLFIKYAGAETVRYAGTPDHAVNRLNAALPLYRFVDHPSLIPLQNEYRTEYGLALIFPWHPGYCLGAMAHNLQQLRSNPLINRYRMLDSLFDFHVLLSDYDYVACGLSNTHLMIDEEKQTASLCDISDYFMMPALNHRGRMPGATWYLPPEAYELNAPLDERMTVYAMGALAYTFLSDDNAGSLSRWQGYPSLYPLVQRAMDPNKNKRFPRIEAFLNEWRSELMKIQLTDDPL